MNIEEYETVIQKEANHWNEFERKSLSKGGIPWWVDLRQAKIQEKNLFWRDDPRKEEIVRGQEKKQLIELACRKKGRVLDLGCGAGWLSLELARRGMSVTAMDISPVRIEVAKRFLQKNPYPDSFGSIDYQVCDLNKIILPEKEFDTVVSWDSLHHILEIERLLNEVKKSLKPGGDLIIFDHIGCKLLKFGGRLLRKFSKTAQEVETSPFEDITGKKLVFLIKSNFSVKFIKTRLSFPISIWLYFLFSKDIFFQLLPNITRIDRFLCNCIFTGEYVFIHAVKE